MAISKDSPQFGKNQNLFQLLKDFDNLSDSKPVAILVYRNFKCIYANHDAQILTEYTFPELISMKFLDFIHPNYKENMYKIYFKILESESCILDDAIKIITRSNLEKKIKGCVLLIEFEFKPAALICFTELNTI